MLLTFLPIAAILWLAVVALALSLCRAAKTADLDPPAAPLPAPLQSMQIRVGQPGYAAPTASPAAESTPTATAPAKL